MGVLFLVDRTIVDNVIFHFWRKECATPRLLQELIIQCFCKVMGVLLLGKEH